MQNKSVIVFKLETITQTLRKNNIYRIISFGLFLWLKMKKFHTYYDLFLDKISTQIKVK